MKKTVKKLTLSRETLRSLQSETLKEAAGGLTYTDPRVCTTNTCPRTYICGEN